MTCKGEYHGPFEKNSNPKHTFAYLVRSEEGIGVGPQGVGVFVGERAERRGLEDPVRHAHFNEARCHEYQTSELEWETYQ
jgi:hypothetical protein